MRLFSQVTLQLESHIIKETCHEIKGLESNTSALKLGNYNILMSQICEALIEQYLRCRLHPSTNIIAKSMTATGFTSSCSSKSLISLFKNKNSFQ
jgi:hypothetical protein